MEAMTFRQLIAKLSEMPAERLDDTATVLTVDGEVFGVFTVETAAEDQDVLDEGHFYLGLDTKENMDFQATENYYSNLKNSEVA